tara:strand:- start:175 stop:411 length:237 start_codon:yes stop_codon:yes gene_type:complete
MARAKKNRGKLLVEFIPFGGIKMNQYDWDTGKTKTRFTKKDFKEYFGKSYGTTKGATFGKAQDKGRKGWGIFIPRMKR